MIENNIEQSAPQLLQFLLHALLRLPLHPLQIPLNTRREYLQTMLQFYLSRVHYLRAPVSLPQHNLVSHKSTRILPLHFDLTIGHILNHLILQLRLLAIEKRDQLVLGADDLGFGQGSRDGDGVGVPLTQVLKFLDVWPDFAEGGVGEGREGQKDHWFFIICGGRWNGLQVNRNSDRKLWNRYCLVQIMEKLNLLGTVPIIGVSYDHMNLKYHLNTFIKSYPHRHRPQPQNYQSPKVESPYLYPYPTTNPIINFTHISFQMLFKLPQTLRALRTLTQTPRFNLQFSQQFDETLTAEQLLHQNLKPRKRTKTVCTIGPRSEDPETIVKLIDEGLSVARLNFNHGDHAKQQKIVDSVRAGLKLRKSGHVSMLVDLKGPTIRTGYNADPNNLITLKKGQLLELTTDYEHKGDERRIACSYKDLPRSTEVGKKILMADGGVSTRVVKIQGEIVTVEVLNDAKLGSRKNMCLPGAVINIPTITKTDENDAINFGLKNKVNFIAISFARYRKDVDYLRKLLIEKDPEHGPYVQIISKIENHEAITNLDELIQASDGIMVARGDLGMQVPVEKVVILQKFIANKVTNAGKFVITATQMLQSMQTKPRPTRAQISDVTNSIFDLADSNMTSGQTSVGLFPVQTAGVLRAVAQETQAAMNYKNIFQYRKYHISYRDSRDVIGAVALAFELDCHFIFIHTDSIKLVGKISSLRPRAYLIVFTDKPEVKGALAIRFGTYCYRRDEFKTPEEFLKGRGDKYGYKESDTVRILEIEAEGEKIVSSRLFRRH